MPNLFTFDQQQHDPVFEKDGELLLRSARIEDAEDIAQYFRQNRTYLKPWEPTREEEFFQPFGWHKRLIRLKELASMGAGFYLLIFDLNQKELVGTISFSQVTRFPLHGCFVGYSLAEQCQGKGFMTRALTMACRYMFDTQNMHRIAASYMPTNHRSAAVLERVGFEKEGLLKSYLLIDGQWEDQVMTAMIHPNWKSA